MPSNADAHNESGVGVDGTPQKLHAVTCYMLSLILLPACMSVVSEASLHAFHCVLPIKACWLFAGA